MGFKRKTRKPRAANWQNIPRENKKWEEFYKAQNLIPESEFEAFKAACQQDLPLTFRITGTTANALNIREMMEQKYIDQLKGIEWDGQVLPAPSSLPFYPQRLAWQVKLAKQVIRRNPQFAKFQRFLVVETTVGNVSRQEAVSMIPPLFMDVKPEHFVLDTCASPGSKTTQLIEALHSGAEAPTGVVIANDADHKRAHMLTHQVKRLNSPNVIVVNHDAQMFPNIKIGSQIVKFDRILCDVPCSGDATMRKNVNVWKDWRVGNGIGLHKLQINITARAVQMLKSGGRLVYSTCSLNPHEDEAVVAQILRQYPEIKLVDVSDQYPGLIRSPGVSTWKVQDKSGKWVTKGENPTLEESLFEPTEDEAKNMHLDRCMRVYPHQQDTGGFFIAVLEKVDDSPDSPQEPSSKRARVAIEPVAPVVGDGGEAPDHESTKLPRDAVTDPFTFMPEDSPVLKECWDFYGLDKFKRDSFVVRNQTGEPLRSIYYVAPSVRSIILENDAKVKFIYAGLKTFNLQKNSDHTSWRIQSEAMNMLYPFATKRILKSDSLDLLKYLVEEGNPRFDQIQANDKEFGDAVVALAEGCAFMNIDDVVCPLWRGRNSVNIMLPKDAKEELLLRKFGIVQESPRASKAANAALAADAAVSTEAADSEAADAADTVAETTAEPDADPSAE